MAGFVIFIRKVYDLLAVDVVEWLTLRVGSKTYRKLFYIKN